MCVLCTLCAALLCFDELALPAAEHPLSSTKRCVMQHLQSQQLQLKRMYVWLLVHLELMFSTPTWGIEKHMQLCQHMSRNAQCTSVLVQMPAEG